MPIFDYYYHLNALEILDGMQRQLEQLEQLGLLNRFVGILTDSRSFISYTRHEYFCDPRGKQ